MCGLTTSEDKQTDRFWSKMASLQDEINNEVDPDPDFEYMEYQQEQADIARDAMREDGINV